MPTSDFQLPVADRELLNHSDPSLAVPETGDYEPVSAGTLEAVIGEISRRIVLIEKRIAGLDAGGLGARNVLTSLQARAGSAAVAGGTRRTRRMGRRRGGGFTSRSTGTGSEPAR